MSSYQTTFAADQAKLRSRLRRMRRSRGFTQTEIAKRIGIARLTYHRLEAGSVVIKPAHLEALSKLYGEEIRP